MKPRGSERDTTQKGQVTPPRGRSSTCRRARPGRGPWRAGQGAPGPGSGRGRRLVWGARAGSVGPSEEVAKAVTDGKAKLRPPASRLGSKSLRGARTSRFTVRGRRSPGAELSVSHACLWGGGGQAMVAADKLAPTAEISDAMAPG